MMNRVFLIGNITKDAELGTTASGVNFCRFDLAVTRNYSQDNEKVTDFFSCTAWRGTAEAVARYCKKGHKIAVLGMLQTRTYEDNEGRKHKAFDIMVQEVEFLTPKANAETDEFATSRSSSTRSSTPTQTSLYGQNRPTLQPMDDDGDIPF